MPASDHDYPTWGPMNSKAKRMLHADFNLGNDRHLLMLMGLRNTACEDEAQSVWWKRGSRWELGTANTGSGPNGKVSTEIG